MAGEAAGWALIDDIDNVINKVLSRAEREGGNVNLKDMLKREAINGLLAGKWRQGLGPAMEIADELLNEVKAGFSAVYDGVADLKFKLVGPGLVGSGSGLVHSIFEIGLQIDPLIGLPYYPGSSIKGAVRSLAESLLDDAGEALFGEAGEGGWMGLIVFSDSYPVGCAAGHSHPCLVVTGDVVNPHYFRPGIGVVEKEYEAQPTPLKHLAIAPGTVFRVVIGVRRPPSRVRDAIGDQLRRLAEELEVNPQGRPSDPRFILALASRLTTVALNLGFAARSGKGYNVMEPVEGSLVTRFVVSLTLSSEDEKEVSRRGRKKGGRRGR